MPDADVEATLATLRALPGIGAWTAQYIAMRALALAGRISAGDLGVLKALGEPSARARRPRASLAALARLRRDASVANPT